MLPINVVRELARIIEIRDMSNRQLESSMQCSHQTIGRIRKRLKKLNLTFSTVKDMDDDDLASKLYPKVVKRNRNKIEPDFDLLDKTRNLKGFTVLNEWKRYKERNKGNTDALGRAAFYQRIRSHYHVKNVAMAIEHYPGESIEIDYAGMQIPYKKPISGDEKKAQIFVATSVYSQKHFAYATENQKEKSWLSSIIRAFEYFQGVPKVLVVDNAPALMIEAGNPLKVGTNLHSLAMYYGCVVVPARPNKPQDKPNVEAGVKLISNHILFDMLEQTFYGLDEINNELLKQINQLNELPAHPHKESRSQRFKEFEKELLQPLPVKPYLVDTFQLTQKVNKYYHVIIEGHKYSVPYTLYGESVLVIADNEKVEVKHKNKRIALHIRSFEVGGRTTDKKHMKPEHLAQASLDKDHYIQWAQQFGDAAVWLIEQQFDGLDCKSMKGLSACKAIMSAIKGIEDEQAVFAFNYAKECAISNATDFALIVKSKNYEEIREDITTTTSHEYIRGDEYYSNGESEK